MAIFITQLVLRRLMRKRGHYRMMIRSLLVFCTTKSSGKLQFRPIRSGPNKFANTNRYFLIIFRNCNCITYFRFMLDIIQASPLGFSFVLTFMNIHSFEFDALTLTFFGYQHLLLFHVFGKFTLNVKIIIRIILRN